jgi:hypothetical protein
MTAVPADDSPRCSSQISERRLRANRANAQRSTGPRSDAGKQESGRNAEKHGAYSQGARAISRGPFAEDQAELDAYLAEFIESAAPRDVLEREEIRRIAMLSRRLRRVDRYEAEILSPPRSEVNRTRTAADTGSLEDQIAVLHTFGRWAVEDVDDGVNFEHILARMRFEAGIQRHVGIELAEEPDTDEELSAQARVEWHIEHVYGSRLEAAKWAIEIIVALEDKIVQRDRAPYAAARASLAETDKVSVITQRISRELDSAVRRYQSLGRRVLDDTPTPPRHKDAGPEAQPTSPRNEPGGDDG